MIVDVFMQFLRISDVDIGHEEIELPYLLYARLTLYEKPTYLVTMDNIGLFYRKVILPNK